MQENEPQGKNPISPQEFSKKVKEKYPQYKDVDDVLLAQKMIEKYPEYKNQVVFGDIKKKDESVSAVPKTKSESAPQNGSSVGAKRDTFTEQITQPNVFKNEYKTIDGKTKTLKPTSAQNKNLEVANKAFEYAKQNVSKENSLKKINDEVDNNQWTDKIAQGFKNAYNTSVGTPLTLVNTLLGGNKDFRAKKYVPLEREKKQALKDLEQEKKSDKSVVINDEIISERAKQLFIEKDMQEQMIQLIDEALPSGYDREGVWKELKLESLRSNDALRSAVASAEVYKAQMQELDNFYASLTPEEKKNGVSGDRFKELEDVREKAKQAIKGLEYLAKNFDNYLQKANTDQEKLELFKYNYNDFEKETSLLKNSAKYIVGGTVKLASEGLKFAANNLNQEEMSTPLNAMSEIGSELMNEAEKDNTQFYRYKASQINSWSDLGSFVFQLGAEQIPILASIYLGGTTGLVAVSASSGGQKINQLEEDAKKPFGRVYSDGEKLLAGLLYAGAEYFPGVFGTARILKDLEKTVSAASTASRRMFTDSFLKTTYKGLGKTAYNVGLEGGTELITAEGQITIDQELLGVVRTQAEKNEMRFESGVAGGLMGGVMTMTGGLIGLGVTQSKLYSDKKDIAEVQKIFSQINAINDEIENNQNLTDAERKDLYQQNNKLNNEAFAIVEKNAKKGIELPIQAKSFLVEVNQRQTDLKAKAKEVSNSNFSESIKKAKIKELENEFNSLEEKRNSTLEGGYNSLTELSDKEVVRLKNLASRELMKEKNPDGTKTVKIEDAEIVKRAVQIYNSEVRESNNRQINEVNDNAVLEENNETIPNPSQIKNPLMDVESTSNALRDVNSNADYNRIDGELYNKWKDLNGKVSKMDKSSNEYNAAKKELDAADKDLSDFRSNNKDLILEHGTPHDFDKFQLDKIGTGEGNQAFGWGLYFTESNKIAKQYAEKLSTDKEGKVYKVTVKDGRTKDWLEWRDALDNSQAEKISKVVASKKAEYEKYLSETENDKSHTGAAESLFNEDLVIDERPLQAGAVYSDLADAFGQKEATRIMVEVGIDGVRFKSNAGKGEAYNYVVFNPESIFIIEKSKSESLLSKEQPTPTTQSESVAVENVEAKIDVSGIGTENYKNKKSQVVGRKREITIADGSKIKGQYKVVSADDILASHNEDNFSKTNGYPVNERGETINDRDYEKDKNAQVEVVKIAQDYDGRAIQQTPVVTTDGIAVDGNNRVMSRKLAAKKGTDTKYKEALIQDADMYGIDPDAISAIKNPIMVFEAERNLPYTTETLSKFNKQDKKEKSSAGKAVEYSKTLSDKTKRQIAEVYDSAERPSDVTSDPKSVKQLRDILLNDNIIQSNEIPRYFDVDKNVMTKEGVSLMENIALGSVFNEKTINTLSIQGMGDIRNKILQSLVGLINNGKLDSAYQLGNEIAKAIEVIYQLKTTKQTIEEYLDQPDIFGEKFTPNIDEYAVILAISDAGFKKWLQNYNNNVGQPDIFKVEDEGITTKRDKSNETISDRKKQVPNNLRSDAVVDAKEDGPENGVIEGEVIEQQPNQEDVEKPNEEVGPSIEDNNEFDNSDLEDDSEAISQGFLGSSNQNQRDLLLSDNGPVKFRFPFQRYFKRVWANTFKSNSGLNNTTAEVVRSRNRTIAAFSDHINSEVNAFHKIIKAVKNLDKNNINNNLLSINDYLAGEKGADVSFLSQEQINQLDYFRERINGLSTALVDILEDNLSKMKNQNSIDSTQNLIDTIKANMDTYITRNYQIFSDDNYRDIITGDFKNISKEGQLRIRNAINFLIREEGMSRNEATEAVAEYLADIRKGKSDFQLSSNGNAVSNFFKKRKNIPLEFRELLGESKDPVYNYVNTVYKISQYLGNIEYQSKLRENLIANNIASTEAKLGYVKLADGDGWKILNDIYVPVEFKEAFEDMQPLKTIESGFYKAWIKIAGYVKLNKTVLSPTTTARNLISGVFLGANSGHLFLMKPERIAEAFNQALTTKISQTQLFDERQKLIKLGVLGDGANSGELMAVLNDFSKEVDRMISKNTTEKVFDFAKKLYAFGDDFYKVAGFYIETDNFIKSGMSKAEAEKKAAYRINNGYPTYSYLPKNMQRLRRVPLVGTFVSFPYEAIRTTKNNLLFVKEDIEAGRNKMAFQRATGMIVANATLSGLSMLTMSMLGISDEDDDAIRDMLPEWQINSKLIYIGTKNGKPMFIDGTAFFASETLMKPISTLFEQRAGRDFDNKLKQSLNEILSPYISQDISFKTLISVSENENEYNQKIYQSNNLFDAIINEPNKIINFLMKQAGPGVYNNATEFMRANEIGSQYVGDKFSSYGKEYTNQEALLGLFGMRLSVINYSAAMSSFAYQVKDSESADKSSASKLVKTSKLLEKDEVESIVKDYAKYHEVNYKKMLNIVNAGKKMGMTDDDIEVSLKSSKLSNKAINDLLKNKIPELTPLSTQSIKQFKQKIAINYKGDKNIKKILVNFYKNKELFKKEIEKYNKINNKPSN
jgi:hypothetical protein